MNNPAKITLVCLVAIAAGSIVLGTLVLRDPQTMAGFSAYLASREAVAAARAGDMGAAREGWEHLSDDSVRAILTPDETRQEALLHLGSVAYGSGDYLRARELYLSSSPARVEADFRRLHDLGNTEYRLGEAEEYDAMRVLLWWSAVDRYEAALAWREDAETRENLEFVKGKLQELAEKARQDGGSSGESWSESSGSGSEAGQTGGSSGERPPSSGGVWRNSWAFERVGRQEGSGEGLSDSERAGLEARTRAIEELWRTGQQYLRRDGAPRRGLQGPIFGTTPLFEESAPYGGKDW